MIILEILVACEKEDHSTNKFYEVKYTSQRLPADPYSTFSYKAYTEYNYKGLPIRRYDYIFSLDISDYDEYGYDRPYGIINSVVHYNSNYSDPIEEIYYNEFTESGLLKSTEFGDRWATYEYNEQGLLVKKIENFEYDLPYYYNPTSHKYFYVGNRVIQEHVLESGFTDPWLIAYYFYTDEDDYIDRKEYYFSNGNFVYQVSFDRDGNKNIVNRTYLSASGNTEIYEFAYDEYNRCVLNNFQIGVYDTIIYDGAFTLAKEIDPLEYEKYLFNIYVEI